MSDSTATLLPTDPSDPYYHSGHPDHARAVAEVQARFREADAPRTESYPELDLEYEETPATTPASPRADDAIAPFDPTQLTLPVLPEHHEWDDAGVRGFVSTATHLGLNQAQATGLVDWYAAWGGELADPDKAGRARAAFEIEATRLGLSRDHVQQLADWHGVHQRGEPPSDDEVRTLMDLKASWGSQFDDRIARARTAVRQVGGHEVVTMLEETGLGSDPRVIRLFERVGAMFDRERTSGADASGPAEPSTMNPDAALRRVNAIMDDRTGPYYDKSHPRHDAMVAHVQRLYRQAFPS